MPGHLTKAVTCLALSLAYCAGSVPASAEDSPAASGPTVRTELDYLASRQTLAPRKPVRDKTSPVAEPVPVAANMPAATQGSKAAQAALPPARTDAAPSTHSSTAVRSATRSATAAHRPAREVSRSRPRSSHRSNWGMSSFFRGIGEVIYSARVPYLPFLGPAPVRFGSTPDFDRTRIVSLEDFARRQEELAAKKKPKKAANDNETSVASNASSTSPNSTSSGNASDSETISVSSTSIVQNGQTGSNSYTTEANTMRNRTAANVSASAQNVDYVPVTSEVVMKYFDNTKQPNTEVRVGVPFVMPYQNEQPLIMDSSAKYSQTEGGTQSNSAK